ncbi:hypothetical protein B0I21_101233 [Sphingobacterium paludis]|uniref:Uncharacterized protein n=1 Tax=Sphingobacterium paludis TaxID=1476465 RepID=A0A4V3E2J0_9SPHI|nr:hypothetical protein B0I21_101233 [Sphingobacterium paludis]
MRYKLYLYYFKSTLLVNLFISFLFSALVPLRPSYHPVPFFVSFSFFFITLGYGMTLLAFHYFGKRTRYLYFNRQISLVRLYGYGFIANIALVLLLHIILKMAWTK